MNASFYTHAAYLIATKHLDLTNDALQVMLVGMSFGGYTFSASHRWVDPGASDATSPLYNELVATNYAGGFGGDGRQALTRTAVEDTTSNRIRLVSPNLFWSALGGATTDTIAAAIVISPGSSDADSLLVAYWPLTQEVVNGQDYTLIMDSVAGNLQLLV